MGRQAHLNLVSLNQGLSGFYGYSSIEDIASWCSSLTWCPDCTSVLLETSPSKFGIFKPGLIRLLWVLIYWRYCLIYVSLVVFPTSNEDIASSMSPWWFSPPAMKNKHNHIITGPQDQSITGSQDHRTTWSQDTGSQNHIITGQQDQSITGSQDHKLEIWISSAAEKLYPYGQLVPQFSEA